MFTGLIQAIGTVRSVGRDRGGVRLSIDGGRWRYVRRARIGDSVAVAGVCLTVVRKRGRVMEFDVVPETLVKTRLGDLGPGDRVNLEHAATRDTLLGGHLVQGHVDGAGRIVRQVNGPAGARSVGAAAWIDVPRALRGYLVEKGSICVEGVSLTIAGLTREGVWIALIPETLKKTTLGGVRTGDRVNLEIDVLAKMVAAASERKAQSAKRKASVRKR